MFAQAKPKRTVTLLFGTQTGTAERFSKQLKTELAQRYGDHETAYEVHDVEEYEHEEKFCQEKLVFLLLATYGDGEPTDNAAAFYAWVTKAASEADKGTGEKLLTVRLSTPAYLKRSCLCTLDQLPDNQLPSLPFHIPCKLFQTKLNSPESQERLHSHFTLSAECQLWSVWPGQQAV